MFALAWHGRGMTIDLTKVPDWALELFSDLHNEAAERHNDETGH